MKIRKLKMDGGQSGTTILLGLIVSLFVIGLLVMIFVLMGSSLQTASYTSTSTSVVNESIIPVTSGTATTVNGYRSVSCTITKVHNGTSGMIINSGNYTVVSPCKVGNLTNSFPITAWNVNYDYTWEADNLATNVMNDSVFAISTATDFFDLFIVIGSMVVLVLLTVVIIVAIRSSGFMGTGTA